MMNTLFAVSVKDTLPDKPFCIHNLYVIASIVGADRKYQVETIIPANENPHSPDIFTYLMAKPTS